MEEKNILPRLSLLIEERAERGDKVADKVKRNVLNKDKVAEVTVCDGHLVAIRATAGNTVPDYAYNYLKNRAVGYLKGAERLRAEVIEDIGLQIEKLGGGERFVQDGLGVTFTDVNGIEKEAFVKDFEGDPDTSELEEYLYEHGNGLYVTSNKQ